MGFVFGKAGNGIMSHFVLDASSMALLASNLFVIVLAIIQGWSLLTIMLIYWMQSVTIGLFTFLKLLLMRKYSDQTILINGKPTTLASMGFWAAKIFMAGFFAVHYGIFHLVYLIFIFAFASEPVAGVTSGIDLAGAIVSGALFFVNHLFSFIYNYKREINSEKTEDLGSTFMAPYVRIIPMHLTIIFGFGFSFLFPSSIFPLLLFMVLKTLADLATHANKHFVGNRAAGA